MIFCETIFQEESGTGSKTCATTEFNGAWVLKAFPKNNFCTHLSVQSIKLLLSSSSVTHNNKNSHTEQKDGVNVKSGSDC